MSLRDEILAGGFDLSNRNDGAIAAALSVNRKTLVSMPIGPGTILAAMYPDGGLFLQALDDAAAVSPPTAESTSIKYTMEVIRSASFDVGDTRNRPFLQDFATKRPEFAAGISALLTLPYVDDVITPQQVAAALEGM